MKILDKKTAFDATKLLIFVVVTTLLTSVLVVTIGNLSFSPTRDYAAVFSDATGVVEGDDVRVAGVSVGSVQSIEVVDRTHALVEFEVDRNVSVSSTTHAAVRYRNLVGQRYIDLNRSKGAGEPLPSGATIPLARTTPALDLTVLFNGFKPLFRALSPSDVNQLSYEIIQVFQGQGGTLESLLGHTASVTSTLAARDQVIGELIDNLNRTLVHIGNRDQELKRLISSFRTLVGGLKKDRQAILGSLDSVSRLSQETAQYVTDIRKPLVKDLGQLRRLAGNLDEPRNRQEIDRALQVLPIKLTKIGRTATYGSFFNFYLCNFEGRVLLPKNLPLEKLERLDLPVEQLKQLQKGSLSVNYNTGTPRCDLG